LWDAATAEILVPQDHEVRPTAINFGQKDWICVPPAGELGSVVPSALEATEETVLSSSSVAGGGMKKEYQFQSLRALLQQAHGYCLLKGWNASYKCCLIHGQAAGLVCNIIVEFPCEVQTCTWTETHAVVLNC
jgi:hypothetical protein